MKEKDTNQFYGPGGWRDTGSLEMGAGTKNSAGMYAVCSYCENVLNVKRNTVGVICFECKKFTSTDKKYAQWEDLPKEIKIKFSDYGNINAPHIVGEEKRAFINYRDKIVTKAYAFREKQRDKSKIYHGPINSQGQHAR